jgi:hypothetical protein
LVILCFSGCQNFSQTTQKTNPPVNEEIRLSNNPTPKTQELHAASTTDSILASDSPTQSTSLEVEEPHLFPIEQHRRWGLMDEKGKVVIKPQYCGEPSSFSEGYAVISMICDSNQTAFIDSQGRLTSARFDYASPFSEGLASVGIDHQQSANAEPVTKFGYIDKFGLSTNLFVIEPQFTGAQSFSEGLAAVNVGSPYKPSWGYIDKKGNIVIKPNFEDVGKFSDGLAAVEIGSKWGYINTKGETIVTPQFYTAAPFADGLAAVGFGDENTNSLNMRYGFIDKTGKIAIKPIYNYAGSFSDGLALVEVSVKEEKKFEAYIGKWGFINHSGVYVIVPQFDFANNFSDGLALVATGEWNSSNSSNPLEEWVYLLNAKWRFVDKTGGVKINLSYPETMMEDEMNANLFLPRPQTIQALEEIGQSPLSTGFHNGLASFFTDFGKSPIYIDKQGYEIIPSDLIDPVIEALNASIVSHDKYTVNFDSKSGIVTLYHGIDDYLFGEDYFIGKAYADFVQYGLKVFTINDVRQLNFVAAAEMTDKYGHKSYVDGIRLSMRKDQFKKFDWENMRGKPIYMPYYRSDFTEVYVDPSIAAAVAYDPGKILLNY